MKTRLLIAERNAAMRDDYRLYLEGCGYEVATAADGLECLMQLFVRPPAVLVLESGLHWGGVDGVIARMWKGWDVPLVPVVLIDNKGPYDELADLVADPVVAHLRKPFHMHKLLECLVDAERSLPVLVTE